MKIQLEAAESHHERAIKTDQIDAENTRLAVDMVISAASVAHKQQMDVAKHLHKVSEK
jgi:hypothetical protein